MEARHKHYVIALAKGHNEPGDEYVGRCNDIATYAINRTQDGMVLFPEEITAGRLDIAWDDIFSPLLRSLVALATNAGYGMSLDFSMTDGLDVKKFSHIYPLGVK